jgi:hypothetical protein
MNGARPLFVFGILSISVALLGTAAAQRPDLPAGPNRELVSRTCQACHDLGMVLAASGLSREGWNSTIDEMITYGLSITPEDRGKIVDYPSTYLGSSAAPAPGP